MPTPTIGQAFPVQYWLLITIPPRVLMTIFAFIVYRLMLEFTTKLAPRKRQIVSMVVATFAGLILNTIGFFTMLELCRYWHGAEMQGIFVMIYAILVTNIVPEYVISLIGVPLVVLGVRRGLKMSIDGSAIFDED